MRYVLLDCNFVPDEDSKYFVAGNSHNATDSKREYAIISKCRFVVMNHKLSLLKYII